MKAEKKSRYDKAYLKLSNGENYLIVKKTSAIIVKDRMII